MTLTHHKEQQNQARTTVQQINDGLLNFEKLVKFLSVYESIEYHLIYLLQLLIHLESIKSQKQKLNSTNHTLFFKVVMNQQIRVFNKLNAQISFIDFF